MPHKPDGRWDVNDEQAWVTQYAGRYNVCHARFIDEVTDDRKMMYHPSSIALDAIVARQNKLYDGTGTDSYSAFLFLEFANNKLHKTDENIPIYWDSSHSPMERRPSAHMMSLVHSLALATPEVLQHAEHMVHMRNFYDRVFSLVYDQSLSQEDTSDKVSQDIIVLADGMAEKCPTADKDTWLVETKFAAEHAQAVIRGVRAHARIGNIDPTKGI